MFALKWISQETGMPSQPAWAYKQSKSLVKKDNDDNLAIKVLIMVIGWLLIISGKCNRLENTGYWCDRRPLKSKKRNIVMITLLIWLVQIGWCLHMFLAWSHTHLQCQVLSLLISCWGRVTAEYMGTYVTKVLFKVFYVLQLARNYSSYIPSTLMKQLFF